MITNNAAELTVYRPCSQLLIPITAWRMLADWEPSPPSPYLADPIAWAPRQTRRIPSGPSSAIARSVVVNRRTARQVVPRRWQELDCWNARRVVD